MTWECAECHEPEGKRVRIDGVCHHCGKPLCRDDRVLIVDKVFMPAGEAGVAAVHCRSCRSEHHSRGDISL
jgi:hypothetical protein